VTFSTQFRSPRYNKLKKHALEIFEHDKCLSPPEWAALAGFYPTRAAYSYLLRLHRFGLLDRSSAGGVIAYQLSTRGKLRLVWLRRVSDG
jgi:hypothetical protein